MTTNSIPNNNELMLKTKLCVGAIIQPLAELGPDEEPIQTVEHLNSNPIRCKHCMLKHKSIFLNLFQQ